MMKFSAGIFNRFFVILILAVAFTARAEEADSVAGPASIVSHIESAGNISVQMPVGLLQRLNPAASTVEARPASGKLGGYRIQVFSDNNARTAKSEARSRARNINAQFPQYPTYVVYSSPYWRLRVGNFRTQEEANRAAHELKEAFPRYSREIRVVRDRITIAAD